MRFNSLVAIFALHFGVCLVCLLRFELSLRETEYFVSHL